MQTFSEALDAAFIHKDGNRSFRFGPDDRYELAFEPLMWGQWYVALYDHHDDWEDGATLLLREKVPVRPGGSERRA